VILLVSDILSLSVNVLKNIYFPQGHTSIYVVNIYVVNMFHKSKCLLHQQKCKHKREFPILIGLGMTKLGKVDISNERIELHFS
jgi:hypothetical protein